MLEGPFRGSDALARGLLTPGQLRGPRFRSLFPDVYVASGRRTNFALLSRAAYLLVARRNGALGGWSAAELLGAACTPARVPAEVVVPGGGGVRAHAGLRVRRERLDPVDVVQSHGCRVTSPCVPHGTSRVVRTCSTRSRPSTRSLVADGSRRPSS